MKALSAPNILDIPGFAMQEVSFMTGVSNCLTLITQGLHLPVDLCDLEISQLNDWITTSLQITQKRDLERTALLDELKKEKTFDPVSMFLRDYRAVIVGLLSPRKRVRDLAQFLSDAIGVIQGYEEMYVTSAETGYPRVVFDDGPQFTSSPHLFGLVRDPKQAAGADTPAEAPSTPRVYDGCGGIRRVIALLTAVFDLANLDARIVPAAASLTSGGRNPRESPIGIAEVALGQREHLTSLALLWMTQFDALWLHLNAGAINHRIDVAAAALPTYGNTFDRCRELLRTALSEIPLHPLWATIANCYQPGTIRTLFGKYSVFFIEKDSLESLSQRSPGEVSDLNRLTLASCITESMRLARSEVGEEVVSSLLPESLRRGGEVAKQLLAGYTVTDLLEKIREISRYTKHWKSLTGQLGWKSGLASPPAELDAAGCDFVLSDGDMYSAHPATVLAGLHPVFSISNTKFTGAAVRYTDTFNTWPEPPLSEDNSKYPALVSSQYSVITYRGHISSSMGPRILSRYWMPMGMHLGETGAEVQYINPRLYAFTSESDQEFVNVGPDAIGSSILGYYSRLSSRGYVRPGSAETASAVSRWTQEGTLLMTSWTPWAVSSTGRDSAQALMLSAYPAGSVDVKVGVVAFFYRATGWNMRSVMRLARNQVTILFDDHGHLIQSQKYRGEVIFNTDVNLGFNTVWVDSLIDLLLPGQATVRDDAKEGKAPVTTQI